jgi:BTB/POZ domain-containing protein KCTD9
MVKKQNKLKRVLKKIWHNIINNKKFFWLLAFVIWGIVVFIIDFLKGKLSSKEHWDNVLVEMHGMLMDIVVFGLLITIYDEINERKNEKKKLMEEINDFKNWGTDEAANRIIGSIKKLNRMQVYKIDISYGKVIAADLTYCKFNESTFSYSDFRKSSFDYTVMRGVDIGGSKFSYCRFLQTDMQQCNAYGAHFEKAKFVNCLLGLSNYNNAIFDESSIEISQMNNCNLRGTSFYKAKLLGTKLTDSDIRGANFKEAEISYGTDFTGCIVESPTWIEDQAKKNILNYNCLVEQYFVDSEELTSKTTGSSYYIMRRKENVIESQSSPNILDLDNTDRIPKE